MRILHVVPSYLPAQRYGGPIFSIHGLCAESARQGHEVHVYTTNVDGRNDSDVPLGSPVDLDGVKVSYFPSTALRRLYYSPAMGSVLASSIDKFDILHLHSVFLWPTSMAARYARTHGKPYVLAPRGMLVKDLIRKRGRFRKTAWIRLFEKRNIEGAAAVHATTEAEGAEIQRFGFALQRLVVVPNGCEPVDPDVTSAGGIRDGRSVVLYLGRMSWKKGLDRLVPAMSHVPDADLVIAGNDDEEYAPKLRTMAARYGLTDRIHFRGFMGGAEKSSLLAGAAVLVLPSYSENFGNVVLEALSHGCPVIVTPEVGLAGWIEQTGAGLVVPGEPALLGREIARVCRDPEMRARLGENGRSAVERDFAWPHVATQMLSVYHELVDSSSARRQSADRKPSRAPAVG